MKHERKILVNVAILVIASGMAGLAWADPMGTAFTYQGRLTDANSPADGLYDFRFEVYDALDGGGQQGSTIDINELDVIDGSFAVKLDFGTDIFTGDARWLEMAVRPGEFSDPCEYTTLAPRLELTPTPYALQTRGIFVDNAGNVGIGTTSPAAKLTVDGAILRDGSTMYGAYADTHINLGLSSTTGTNGQNYLNATVGGGSCNSASGDHTTVGGGEWNVASGARAAVGGGEWNIAGGNYTTVSGGYDNIASGSASIVPGGWSNAAGGDYSFAAGHRAKANHHGAFVWGDSADADFASTAVDQFLIRASGGVGIGTPSPSEKLEVNGTIKATAFSGDGSGLTNLPVTPDYDWIISGSDMYSTVTGNVGIGMTSPNHKLDVDGHINSSESYKLDGATVVSNTGTNNILVGKDAGVSITTGNHNSAMGMNALNSNTTGNYNSSMGCQALRSNTTGNGNSAVGNYALSSNTTGKENSAVGNYALTFNTAGKENSAMGGYALFYNTWGIRNSAMGYQALRYTTGNFNSALGFEAGNNNSTGSGNVFLGYRAGYNETGDNKLYIANHYDPCDPCEAPLIYGDFSTGNVGIGTTSPDEKLTVVTSDATGKAVYGKHSNSGNYGRLGDENHGVFGLGAKTGDVYNYGVAGRDMSGKGSGVYGEGYNTGDVQNKGGEFRAKGKRGWGVSGWASNSEVDAANYGGYFVADGSSGRGVYAAAPYGDGIGIYARGGPTGYAANFRGNVRIGSRISNATVMELGEGLDYAEGFDVSGKSEIAGGTVLVIDTENPGKLAISDKAYDSRVAGIVAGAKGQGSGVRLGSDEFDYDVALAGRVYCNVDATEAGVQPGDLLTTSATSGYAMKAVDYMRAQGAILGKAMEKLEKGEKGQILVLVTLQ